MDGAKVIPIGQPRTVRQGLVDTLSTLLAARGFKDLTVDRVARAAKLERAVILRHFGDLDHLVVALGQSEAFWPKADELMAGSPVGFPALPIEKQVAEFFKATVRALLARPRTLDILAWELVERNRFSRLLEYPRVRTALEFFEGLTGEVPESLDLTAVVAVIGGAVLFLTVRSRQSGFFGGLNLFDAPDRLRVEETIDILLKGVFHYQSQT